MRSLRIPSLLQRRLWLLCVLLGGTAITAEDALAADPPVVRVGSKAFTESIILGEIVTQTLRQQGLRAIHSRSLGDAATYQALVRGDIDAYTEYTGTLRQSIFKDRNITSRAELKTALAEEGLLMSEPWGFENSYSLGVMRDVATKLNLKTMSDLQGHPELRFGFTEEFLNRGDGWPPLREHYQLPQQNITSMAHELSYVALQAGDLDVVDLYTTDAEIPAYDLVALADDQDFFPEYAAVVLYRADLKTRVPAAVAAIKLLAGEIDEPTMQRLNSDVRIDKQSESAVAARFLNSTFGWEIAIVEDTWQRKLWRNTRQHLFLVGVAMLLGSLVAIPLGVIAYKYPRVGRVVLWSVSILQTIPALALLALMVPLLGIHEKPAIAALFCYSMLPIVRNTHAGLAGISPALRESAAALGLPSSTQLWRIELPLASPLIFAGLRTATVLSIGFATLGAFVGAGGYGEPILTGIRLQDTSEILQGAIPAAVLAITSELLFEWSERFLIPAGLRLPANAD